MQAELVVKARDRAVYGTRRWRWVRRVVLDRDGWKCTKCGRVGRLEVHHRQSIRRTDADPFDPDGCETLCRVCHFRAHDKARKLDVPGRAEWAQFAGTAS